MSSKEDLFKLIGLSHHKIQETIKNEALSKLLVDIITYVNYFFFIKNQSFFVELLSLLNFKGKTLLKNNEPFEKSIGVLLYQIGTKLKSQFENRLQFLVENVVKKNLNNELQLTGK